MSSSSSSLFTYCSSQIIFGLSILLLSLPVAFAQSATSVEVAAIVNGQAITSAAVDATITAQLYPLQQQIYALRKVALENLIARSLLEEEAQRKNVSLEEVKTQMTAGMVRITDEQVESLYLEHAAAFASMSPDEAKERLRLDLESQARMRNYRAAVAAMRQEAEITILLDEPRLSVTKSKEHSSLGSKTAPVVITEFSDFQCPYCRIAQSWIKQLVKEHSEDVRLDFKHLPLDIHSQAFSSASAAYCAGEQQVFWKMHDALFETEDLSAKNLKLLADSLGMNVERFSECLGSERAKTAVRSDLQEARRLGVNSTPTFLINGQLVRGAASFESLRATIKQELQRIRERFVSKPPHSSRGSIK